MTDHIHIDGHDEDADFERQDLSAKAVLLFLLALLVGCVLVGLLLKGMYSYLDAYERHHQPEQNPLVQSNPADTRVVEPGRVAQFPQPRLETNETMEINAFRLKEVQTLNSYGWVDQQAGVVRIPIDRAMELLAQRGLPTRPQTGVAPSSDVNMGKEAARQADSSKQPEKKK